MSEALAEAIRAAFHRPFTGRLAPRRWLSRSSVLGSGLCMGLVLGLALWLALWAAPAQAEKKAKRAAALAPVASASGVPQVAPMQGWPASAREWWPWALQGHEHLLCPRQHDDAAKLSCVWPSTLSLKAGALGARFEMQVQVFGPASWVWLPGEAAAWPQEVTVNGRAAPVSAHQGWPAVWLAPGWHAVKGQLSWDAMPQDVKLPAGIGTLDFTLDGRTERRNASADGRLWLRPSAQEARAADEVTVRTLRRLEDGVPMTLRTRFELTVSGQPRELELPLATLPGWVSRSIESRLPVRLQDDGRLKLQARAGQWSIEIHSQHMKALGGVTLPAGGASGEEVWSFEGRNELRLLSVEGAARIDPKQVDMPDDWRSLPAYRLQAGGTLKLLESRRGNANPGPDALEISRTLWLDFNGQGYTAQDRISGTLSRSTRLEMASPGVLGRASSEGQDQTITRMSPQGPSGLALRSEQAHIEADSRIEGPLRSLSATGWLSDFTRADLTLKLPPGWRLLHAQGPDQAQGSWVSGWTLWDFFFVLLSALAAGKLLGWRCGALLGAALVLGWHMSGTPPRWLWLALLGGMALLKVLPHERARHYTARLSQAVAALIGLALLPYAVDQVRLSIYPSLGHHTALPSLEKQNELPAEAEMAQAAPALMSPRVMSKRLQVMDAPAAPPPLATLDTSARVQTGPGLPRWNWNSHALSWQGPVQQGQGLQLWLLPPWGTAMLRLGSVLLMAAALWQLGRRGGLWPAAPAGGSGQTGPDSRPPRAAAASTLAPEAEAEPRFEEAHTVPNPHTTEGFADTEIRPQGPQGHSSHSSHLGSWAGSLVLLGASLALLSPLNTWAKGQPEAGSEAQPPALASPALPWPQAEQLRELRRRGAPDPKCMPECVDVPRLWVSAAGARLSLRLELHAQAGVALPLPSQGNHWQPHRVSLNGQLAPLRRDDNGQLWLAAPQGVSQVVLEADAGDSASVDITLPWPVREVKASLDGWSLSGLDARGLASGALMLARDLPRSATQDRSTERDSLPPLVRVSRSLSLGLSWQMNTRIERISPSRAPVQVQFALLTGERVTDETVKVDDGMATVQLGQQDALDITSQLQPGAKLEWLSRPLASQVEVWSLSASPQWQVLPQAGPGLPPIWHFQNGQWMPSWQPWPGEKLTLTVSKPQGVDGQTFTIDQLDTTVTPGARATDVRSQLELRSSLGGNHRLQLPTQAELRAVSLDGQALPLRLEAGALTVPIPPGAHRLVLEWRLPQGMQAMLRTPTLQAGSPGVNEKLTLKLPEDRIALALGGPLVGPAVLFWGALLVVLGVAAALSRLRTLPLGALAWALLGLGLVPVDVWGLALVLAWFLALSRREQAARQVAGQSGGLPQRRWVFNGMQLLLLLGAVWVAGVLLHALQVGLLGYPDLMIAGNGSTARELHWYADRFGQSSSQAWVLSMPLWLYRVLMLLWALWLASALLGWLRWAWAAYSAGGVWRGAPTPIPPAPPAP
jgi:hypothetical protein